MSVTDVVQETNTKRPNALRIVTFLLFDLAVILILIAPSVLHSPIPALLGYVILIVIGIIVLAKHSNDNNGKRDWITTIAAIIGIALSLYSIYKIVTFNPAQAYLEALQKQDPSIIVLKPVADDGPRAAEERDPHHFKAEFKFTAACLAVPEPHCPLSKAELDQLLDAPGPDGSVRKQACDGPSGSTTFYITGFRDDNGTVRFGKGRYRWGSGITITAPVVRVN